MTVTRVLDGDTIEISPAIGGNDEVRLIGVDTPETVDPESDVQPYGPEASRFTERQLEGERVELEFDQEREDQFGRLLAYVYVSERWLFNETLLSEGYAQLYIVPPNDRYEERFRAAQQDAREAQRGLWGLPRSELCELANRGNGIGEGSPGCANTSNAQEDEDCADFASQAAAQSELESDSTDPNVLDADGDGQACETYDYGTAEENPAQTQYGDDTREQDVMPETIPDKPLPKTGGWPILVGAAVMLVASIVVGSRIVRT